MRISLLSAGGTLALFVGLGHLAWALMVAIGWAEPLLDLIFRLHFLTVQLSVAPFDLGRALALVGLTAFGGFVSGCLLAAIWNLIAYIPEQRWRARPL
ncbi:hypothetical protein [Caulobacter sp. CCUG 60055]|uniref:hypothetical protein n=1 Tax=Caulobacter sp. CCUG 60055 TaxID=2100090 RepID=UPI001FA8187A|nr:hypothetical protein [Caulobacter sp. CCUG 60055]